MISLLRAIKLILTLNCAQSAKLVSESFDRKLSRAERIAVFCHHRICKSSRELAIQLRELEKSCREAASLITNESSSGLDESARQRILQNIHKQTDTNGN
jgi:ABC-type uncharacterized transport system ATPase subunit